MAESSDYEVVFGTPTWSLNGVNVFGRYLVRELQRRGVHARVLVTHPDWPDDKPMDRSADDPIEELPVGEHVTWRDRYELLEGYLREQAPCVYLPNHDFELTGLCPALPGEVGIVGIVHSDDPQHYEHVERVGSAWDAVVGVSRRVAEKTRDRFPHLAERVTCIPYGVSVPETITERDDDHTLRILYAGRLIQHQKRIFDLVGIAERLRESGVDFRMTIAGDGPDAGELRSRMGSSVPDDAVEFPGRLPHPELMERYRTADVILLTSAFEGLPIALLEAMARGCVPVVSDIESGVPELIEDGENGFRVPIGDLAQFAARLRALAEDPERLRATGERARDTIREGPYRIETMTDSYEALFGRILQDDEGIDRRRGAILPPPEKYLTWKDWLPPSVRRMGHRLRRFIGSRVS